MRERILFRTALSRQRCLPGLPLLLGGNERGSGRLLSTFQQETQVSATSLENP